MIVANQNNNEFNQVLAANGEVKTKIILNIPTK
jgi:subtilase family serine protease